MSANPVHKNQIQLCTPAERVQQFASIPVMTAVGVSAIFLAAAFNLVDLNIGKDTVALDSQVLVKLGISGLCGLYGGYGLLTDSRIKNILLSFPGAWLTIIIGMYFLGVLNSLDPIISLASSIALLGVVLATLTAVTQIGMLPILNTVFYAGSLFVAGSWFAFFAVPELGVFAEPLSDGEFASRMGGLAHPNTLGQFSGLTIVLGVVMWRNYNQKSMFRVIVIGLAAAALVACVSRASLGATFSALLFCYRDVYLKPEFTIRYLVLGALAVLALMCGYLFLDLFGSVESWLAMLSKSGDTEELTTATGRSDIWAYSVQLILERPLTGWGAATSKDLLADFSMYTHNLVLNVALSTGVIGAAAAVLMLLTRIGTMFRRSHQVADTIIVFVFLNGLFENVIFSLLASLPTIVFVIALCWWNWDSDPAVNESLEVQPS